MNKFSTLPHKNLFPYLFDSVVFLQVILNLYQSQVKKLKVLKFRFQWLNTCLPNLDQRKTFYAEWNTFICHEQHVCLLKFGARNTIEILFAGTTKQTRNHHFRWWKMIVLRLTDHQYIMHWAGFQTVTYLEELRRFHHGNGDIRCHLQTGDSCSISNLPWEMKFSMQTVSSVAYSSSRSV